MKRLFSIALLSASLFADQARAEYFTHVYAAGTTNIIQVPTNKVMSKIVIMYCSVYVEKNGIKHSSRFYGFDEAEPSNNGTSHLKITGPATVNFLAWSTSNTGFVSYEISDNESTALSKPSNAVVIPTDATGPVEIVLESSTDLITWTAAEPGLYGSSSPKRFFRVRAIAH